MKWARAFYHACRYLATRDVQARSLYRWYAGAGEARRFRYPFDSASVVIDGGGFRGDFAAGVLSSGVGRVLIFEPIPAFQEILRARFEADGRVEVIPLGLAGRDGRALFAEAGEASGALGRGPTTEVKLIDLYPFLQAHGIEDVQLLKLNIEGGEYDVLEGLLRHGRVIHFRFLAIQFHRQAADSVARRDAIRAALSATHEEMWNFPWVWESWKRREP